MKKELCVPKTSKSTSILQASPILKQTALKLMSGIFLVVMINLAGIYLFPSYCSANLLTARTGSVICETYGPVSFRDASIPAKRLVGGT